MAPRDTLFSHFPSSQLVLRISWFEPGRLYLGKDILLWINMERIFTNADGAFPVFTVLEGTSTKWLLLSPNFLSTESPPESNPQSLNFVGQGQSLIDAVSSGKLVKGGPFVPHWWSPSTYWTGFSPIPLNEDQAGRHWYYRPGNEETAFHFIKGRYQIDDFRRATYRADVILAQSVTTRIKSSPLFNGANCWPAEFELRSIDGTFQDLGELQSTVLRAKLFMLSSWGLLRWLQKLSPATMHQALGTKLSQAVESLSLDLYGHRGFIVHLCEDWRTFNLDLCVRNGIPVYISYPEQIASDPRFAKINVEVLATVQSELEEGRGLSWFEFQFPKLQTLWSNAAQYNSQFVMELDVPVNAINHRFIPTSAKVAIIDFPGWNPREITQDRWMMYKYFFKYIQVSNPGDSRESFVMYRWKKKAVTSYQEHQHVRKLHKAYEDRFGSEPLWLLKEKYRSQYAPKPGQQFDEETGVEVSPPSCNAKIRSRPFLETPSPGTTGFEDTPLAARLFPVQMEVESNVSLDMLLLKRLRTEEETDGASPGPSLLERLSKKQKGIDEATGNEEEADMDSLKDSFHTSRSSPESSTKLFIAVTLADLRAKVTRASEFPRIAGILPAFSRGRVHDNQLVLDSPHFLNKDRIIDLSSKSEIWSRVPSNHLHEVMDWSTVCMPRGFFSEDKMASFIAQGRWNERMKSKVYLIIKPEYEVFLRSLALDRPDLSSIWDLLEIALVYDVPFQLAMKLNEYEEYKPKPDSLTMDDRVLSKAVVSSDRTEPPLTYRRSGAALLAEYKTRIRDLINRPHMRATIGMPGTTGIIARIYGEARLIASFMEGPSIVVRQHLQGETDTDSPDARGLIWDKVNASEIDIMHGFMTSEKEEDRYLFPTNDLLDSEMLKEWGGNVDGYVHDVIRSVLADFDRGKAVARTRGEWRQYLRSGFGLRLKQYKRARDLEMRGGPAVEIIPSSQDYEYGRALALEAWPKSWNKERVMDLDTPEYLKN